VSGYSQISLLHHRYILRYQARSLGVYNRVIQTISRKLGHRKVLNMLR